MKRYVEVNPHNISRHSSFFSWNECWFCNQDFRREPGYKWLFASRFWCYSCASCSSSISHCNANLDHARAKGIAALLGNVPPAPPVRSYNNQRR